ncbi:hypothetical protein BJY04DRAFT_216712 [Aspergillus karnatakaensis]|uniref:uncharacterized protein n=1 Tax=Aspergillus karnatakaensis TaxID=1810916 RepID=UPI003CCE347C
MSDKITKTLIGCLLDVSGSMREVLESKTADERPIDRLHAAISAALRVAETELQRDLQAVMFVAAFGLKEEHGRPSAVDLCGVAEALLGNQDGGRSGHDRLIELANTRNLSHITEYIRSKLTSSEAGIVHAYLDVHTGRIDEFVNAIPTQEQLDGIQSGTRGTGAAIDKFVNGAVSQVPVVGSYILDMVGTDNGRRLGTHVEDLIVDSSKALKLAHEICSDWLQQFTEFVPRPVEDVVHLLQRLNARSAAGNTDALNSLDEFIYGETPLQYALKQALATFQGTPVTETRLLLLVSDGMSTDVDYPLPMARDLKKAQVTIASLFLTNHTNTIERRLYDRKSSKWHKGQKLLFDSASVVPVDKHPIPVLTSVGWEVPSSGECSLYASVCSTTALDEFCSLLVSAQLGKTDAMLDIIGRIKLDKIINSKLVETCQDPSDQKQSKTCYAHAIAAVIYMALLRIYQPEGVHRKTVEEIRNPILKLFPPRENGRVTEQVLKAAVATDRLHYRQVDEAGARQAVLRRRPVVATFRLLKAGYGQFKKHFEDPQTCTEILTYAEMEPYHNQSDGGGHAVVLYACTPTSLSFLNSWGKKWGQNGSFSIESTRVLENSPEIAKMRFYDVFWYENDLSDQQRQWYRDKTKQDVRNWTSSYPSLLEIAARCPCCQRDSPVGDFSGTIYEAVCPHCSKSFKPEPGYLVQALYVRAGMGHTA